MAIYVCPPHGRLNSAKVYKLKGGQELIITTKLTLKQKLSSVCAPSM